MHALSLSLDLQSLDRQPWTRAAYVPLHFVTSGRNAWWRTWIQRYSDGALNVDLSAAKAFCEPRRVQGTRFAIEQLPALVFTSDTDMLAVAQINTTEPLKYLDRTRLDELDTMLDLGSMTLGQIARLFNRESYFWLVPPPKDDALLIAAARADEVQLDSNASTRLIAWTSYSLGRDYELGWTPTTNGVDPSHVGALARFWNSK